MKLTLPLAFAAVTVGGVTAKTGNGPGAGVAVGLGVGDGIGVGVGVGVGVAPLRPAWVIAITLGLPLALLAVMVICPER